MQISSETDSRSVRRAARRRAARFASAGRALAAHVLVTTALATTALATTALATTVLATTALASGALAAEPAPLAAVSPDDELPFSTQSYAAARDAAAAQGRLFVVDATAVWCAPCKQMEKAAWPAADVRAWLAEHAIAVQVDVDEQKELAETLAIEAMPTIIVFRGDIELDRREGALSAADLLAWLEDVAAGRAGRSPLLAKGLELLDSDDVEARLKMAQELLHHGERELALKHYLWLWPNTRSVPKYFGVRCSFLLMDMKRLSDSDDDAAEAIARLFEEVRAQVIHTDAPEPLAWLEFSSWCREFDVEWQVADWYDRHHAPDGSVAMNAGVRPWLMRSLGAAGRWADAGRVGDLPAIGAAMVAAFHKDREYIRSTGGGPDHADFAESVRRTLRDDLALLTAAAWAAGHEDERRALATLLLTELDDTLSRVTLAEACIDVVGAQPDVRRWIAEAAASGERAPRVEALREKLRAELREEEAARAKPSPAAPDGKPPR